MSDSDLRLFDTMARGLRLFVPREPGQARVYSCGPTVYGPAHVGNFRSFLFADILVRYLRYRGLTVTWVMNLTDIDDKIIAAASTAGLPFREITTRYETQFLADAQTLGMSRPDVLPRASEHIEAMSALIVKLLADGHAYQTPDGSVFFKLASSPRYGQLAGLTPGVVAQMQTGARVEADEYGKDDIRDFALWKGQKASEPSWDTPFGPGRPGWHIECSAMSMAHLGPTLDIHTGGVDLVFPHHTDEIAQSESVTGVTFSRYWLHCAHLASAGAKMSKSVGNIERVADVLGRGISPRVLRLALIGAHYRSPLAFGEGALATASTQVERLDHLMGKLAAYENAGPDNERLPVLLASARTSFEAAMNKDLNVPGALSATFKLARELNRRLESQTLSAGDARRASATLRELDRVLAILPTTTPDETPDPASADLLARRVATRAAHDWAESDRLRAELATRGWVVEDTSEGQRAHRS